MAAPLPGHLSLGGLEGKKGSWGPGDKGVVRRALMLFAKCFALAVLYYLAVVISMKLRFSTSDLCLLWPSNALLVGTLTLSPKGRWWAYLLAVIPAHIAGMASYHQDLLWLIYEVAVDIAFVTVIAAILQRFRPEIFLFETLKAVLIFLAVSIGVGGLMYLAAVYPVVKFSSNGVFSAHNWHEGIIGVWIAGWTNNAATYLAFVPTILVCATQGRSWLRELSPHRVAETAIVTIVFVTLTFLAYRNAYLNGNLQQAFFLLPMPLLLWIAVRYGPAGTCVAITGLVSISSWCAYAEEGSFLRSGSIDRVIAMQVSWIMMSAPVLALSAVVRERKLAMLASLQSEHRYRESAEELNSAHAELRQLTHQLFQAQEAERRRIARELHDDINQRLALLTVQMVQLKDGEPGSSDEFRENMGELSKRAEEISTDVQAISHELHSSKLEILGLLSAARGFCEEFAEQQKIQIDFLHHGTLPTVSYDISICLFRVMQEALRNAVKHSGVRRFVVKLQGAPSEIALSVSDSGVGFDSDDAACGRGLGLVSMRERLHWLGGTISIKSKPNCGTTVLARVPANSAGEASRAVV